MCAPIRGVHILYMGLLLCQFKGINKLINNEKMREMTFAHTSDKNEPGMKAPLDLRSDADG